MPNSYNYFKQEIKEYFKENVPNTKRILDVGPGEGTYSKLIRELGYKMDCIEIYEPYTITYNLRDKYDNVFIGNILNQDITNYDFIILGDVLEHISADDSQKLIQKIVNQGKECLVAVPYLMPQDGLDDNDHEKHLQEDLTPEIMKQRYPELECLYSNYSYGYYIVKKEREKVEKAYVLYANENYFNIVSSCVKSIRTFSKLPIFVYLLDSDKKINIDDVTTIKWTTNSFSDGNMYLKSTGNFYIDRSNEKIYRLLIQRPMIVKDVLEKYSKVVAYVDSDSVATQHCDKIFDMYDSSLDYPYFVEGIYDYLIMNGRGGAASRDDLSGTLEHPACELFGVNQYVREKYRQTGYFVAGEHTLDFLEEWYWMCTHPKILKNFGFYAPFHEETIANVLLWKYNKQGGLPYIYINGDNQTLDRIFDNNEFNGHSRHLGPWLKIPATEEQMFFVHGEKRDWVREEILERLKIRASKVKTYPNIDPTKNWGDIISKFLLEYYSGKKLKKDDVFYFDDASYMLDKNGKIVGVGSSMKYVRPDDYVWGTGCIDEYNIGSKPKKVYSVRGSHTREQLLKRGWDVPEIYGDPALLFPRVYNPKTEKKYQYGLIPHCVDFFSVDGLKSINRAESLGIKIINITAGIYEFIDQLLECENILSSSLHGLIAADAYGIPNHRVKLSNLIHGGHFKYMDYYSSVNRNDYHPTILDGNLQLRDLKPLKFEIGEIPNLDLLLENSPWNDPDCVYIPKTQKLRVLFLAPHLSTGGMPGFLLRRIELLQEYCPEFEIFVVEFSNFSPVYVVQRNKIIEILPETNFWSLGDDKMKLIDIIKENEIDIVHVDEMIEGFDSFNKVPKPLMNELYSNDRTWRMVETCHNVWFDPGADKQYHPDAYAFCTPYHKEKTFANVPSYGEVLEFPIEKKFITNEDKIDAQTELDFNYFKTHVINVGLWTSGKNQSEGIEIARLVEKTHPDIHFHFIGNQAPNFKQYWEPVMENLPSNVTVWGERSDVSTFMKAADVFMFNSTWECNPLVLREAASYGLKILSRNLPQYMDMFTPYITPIDEDINKTKDSLISLILSQKNYDVPEGQGKKFALDHLKFYELVNSKEPKQQTKINSDIRITQYFVNQPFLEIKGESDSTFEIKFFDEFGICHYHNKTKSNHWFKLNREYYTKWNTKVWEDGTLIYDDTLNYKGKKVFISFDSGSLGDTIAWIPYVLEFKKKHECDVVVSTHKNFLFEKMYPELEFVHPGSTVNGIHGMYVIGWFYDPNKEPEMPNTIPLQQAATNILGLEYTEIKPRIDYKVGERPYEQKYVSIATNSTSGCKFWTKEGWQGLIDHLHSLGYKVINVSKEKNPFNNAEQISDTSMENTMNVIHHSEFFIGLSSGLSWLAWGMGKHVVMISNFTEPDHEFTTNCTRIAKLDVCNGCWNSPIYKFDKGDWDWCPVHKGTKRQFECHTTITSKMVIDQIQHLLTPKLFELKKPKIQIKHLLTKIEDEREILSIESIKSLAKYGFDYQPIINEVYDGLAPIDGCNRPEHISKDNTPGELSPGYGLGWLTGRHYGCYLAHRGVLETISDEYEYTLVFEADALITSTIDEFIDIVFKSCEIMDKDDVYYLSLSNNPSRYKEKINEYFSKTAPNQDCAHAYIIRNKDKEWWLQRLIDCKWDAADIWFNYVFRTNPKLRYTTNKSYSNQSAGYSLIDKIIK